MIKSSGNLEDATLAAWHAALRAAEPHLPKRLRVLDVGCGTGFASITVLRTLGTERVDQLVCIDPSPHMLAICEGKLAPFSCDKHLHAKDIAQLLDQKPAFDLIVTNSVLHHVFDLGAFLRHLDRVW
jgi:ubiquinone/menaquinone biosynthesis C-methylase UbiE